MSGAKLIWEGDAFAAAVTVRAKASLKMGAEMILAHSKMECPVDTGALLRSGTVTELNEGKTQELSYNTPYAHRQHEGDYAHTRGKRKYLEDPLRADAPKVFKLMERLW